MRKKILATIVLAVGLGAPGAAAALNHASFDCRLLNLAQEDTTGSNETFTGVSVGYVDSPNPGEVVSIRCFVKVDGVEVSGASTPAGTGVNAALTAGQVTYNASDTQTVELCAEWTAGFESGTTCFATILVQVPPQELLDIYSELGQAAGDVVAPLVDVVDDLGGGCVTVVNSGTCNSGICLVNSGTCNGGVCVINDDWCGRGCVAVWNTGICGTPPPPPPPAKVDPR